MLSPFGFRLPLIPCDRMACQPYALSSSLIDRQNGFLLQFISSTQHLQERSRVAMKLLVDEHKCCASGECVKVCPMDAIRIVNGVAVIDYDKCDMDGICIAACPHQAIDYIE
jgi:uncharacterized Fe-S center protein